MRSTRGNRFAGELMNLNSGSSHFVADIKVLNYSFTDEEYIRSRV